MHGLPSSKFCKRVSDKGYVSASRLELKKRKSLGEVLFTVSVRMFARTICLINVYIYYLIKPLFHGQSLEKEQIKQLHSFPLPLFLRKS